MSVTIAISGKGGSGKTTIAAMVVRLLAGKGKSILAVDADPNCCLGQMLGVEPEITVAQLREKAKASQPAATGMDKVRAFEYGIAQAVVESKGFDLLTMGRPEGPGCYCAVNNLLRTFLDDLSKSYGYVIIDNEAGMEHLSRRTTNDVDLLCIVAEATKVGLTTTERIFHLAKALPITVKNIGVIFNRTDNPERPEQIDVLGCVPFDRNVFDASMQGQTVFDIDLQTPAFSAVRKITESVLGKSKAKVAD
jgi:CO dehydrogenase maturation factor